MTRLEALETVAKAAHAAGCWERDMRADSPNATLIFSQINLNLGNGKICEINLTSEIFQHCVAALEESLINHPEKP